MDKDILEKAIAKAIVGGWKYYEGEEGQPDADEILNIIQSSTHTIQCYEHIIFNKGFAKALWGDDYIANKKMFANHAWQYHLQNMVISDDPIKYLADNLPVDNQYQNVVQL